MKKTFKSLAALLMGLFTAQLIGTVQVYLSNRSLHATVTMLDSAGYLTVPNRIVAETLLSPLPAVAGGFFFTLTVGAGLALASVGIILLLPEKATNRKRVRMAAVALWVLSLAWVNAEGFNPFATAYFLLVPAVVFLCMKGTLRTEMDPRKSVFFVPHLAAVCCLAALWAGQLDRDLFSQIRDRILLTTAAGRVVNDFYYSYTLHPAYAFKTIEQRTMRACRLKDIPAGVDSGRLRSLLIKHDYLPVDDEKAELTIAGRNDMLTFLWNGRELLQLDPSRFIAAPDRTLGRVSALADKNRFFRQFTFLSLLFAFPLLLYVIIAVPAAAAAGAIRLPTGVTSALVCFAAGLSLFIFFINGKGTCHGPEDLAAAAASPRWQNRVAALDTAFSNRIDIAVIPSYEQMKSSPLVVERFKVARALGESRSPDTYRDLLSMLDDPHANVVCTAYHSLGRRNRQEAVKEILERFPRSARWYCQWYAYRALRSLGWSQEKYKPGRP